MIKLTARTFLPFALPHRPLLFGDSAAWTVNAERVVVLGWGTAMLMQFAHPLVAAGVRDHSIAIARPRTRFRRLRRTIGAMLGLTFGTPDDALAVARRINTMHDRVHGRLRQTTGIFPAGTPYSAHDPGLLLWVHATLLDALPRAYDHYVRSLPAEAKDRLCAEGVGMTAVLGMRAADMPASVAALHAYMDRMIASGAIAVGEDARSLARAMFSLPLGPFLYIPTVGLLPPAIRTLYGFPWTRAHGAAFQLLGWLIRRALPFVPAAWRYWPEARTALASGDPARLHTPSAPKLHPDALRKHRAPSYPHAPADQA